LVGFLWKHKYILRTGIEHITYVHYKYVEPWTINTYYAQRKEKDPDTEKRPNTSPSSSEPPAKQAKLTVNVDDSPVDPAEKADKEEDTSEPLVERKPLVIRPAPWIRINGSLNRRVVDRWISAILLHLVTNSGIDLKRFAARFSYLVPVHLRYMLEVLEQLGCIELWTLASAKVSLFSEYSPTVSRK
jgi:general transcription factor 3C polypeptide 1